MTLGKVVVPFAVAGLVLALVLGVMALTGSGDGSGTAVSPGGGGSPPSSGSPGSPGSVDPSAPAPDQPMTRFTTVTRGPDGATLGVSFYGGVEDCYRYTVRAEESDRVVRLALREERTFEGACIELAQQYERAVPLDAPLGDRRVVDAKTGETLLAAEPAGG